MRNADPSKEEIRLRIVEVLVPAATRVGLVEPEHVVKTCTALEKYVLGSELQGADKPDAPPVSKAKPPKPRKPRQR